MRPPHLVPSLRPLLTALLLLAFAAAEARAEISLVGPSRAEAERHMVSSANPLASAAGREMLREGGSAVDAAIATQMVLTLVEPGESGLGGGAFLLHYEAETGALRFYDGRETAPQAATPDRFLWGRGRSLPFYLAVMSGRSVGTPGLLAMLAEAHAEHGRLPWARLFEPAIALARDGFPVTPRLSRQIRLDPTLRLRGETRSYFYHYGVRALRPGAIRRNPELADTLHRIAVEGPDAFYEGEIAEDLVRAVRGSRLGGPGDLSLADLRDYEPVLRDAICRPYRDWTVCGSPPPSSGGTTILQILGILEPFDLAALEPDSAEAVHLFAEASRLAFADRVAFLGDGEAARALVPQLLDRDYLAGRSALISPRRALPLTVAGTPPPPASGERPMPRREGGRAAAPGGERGSTSHFSVVDGDGNAVALTSSIEQPFGSRLLVRGFLLNNQLTDFAFRPLRNGEAVPNAVEPGKRPLSAMSPTFVFDAEGDLRYVLGSPGGSRIIGFVAKTLVGLLDWELPLEEAVALGNVVHRGGRLELERGSGAARQARALRRLGHRPQVTGLTSGLHAIAVTPDGLVGVADSRRGGGALGD